MTKLLDQNENGQLHLIDNDDGWNTLSQQVSKYLSSFDTIVIIIDQSSWCCFETFARKVRYLHGPVSGISKGQYGLTAREVIAFAVWNIFDFDGTIPPDG